MSLFEILGTECTTSKCARPNEVSCPCRTNDRDSRSLRFAFAPGCGSRRATYGFDGRRAAWGTGLRNLPNYGNESPFINPLGDCGGSGGGCDSGCGRGCGCGSRTESGARNESGGRNEFTAAASIQLGYSTYNTPRTNRYDYKFYNVSGWRVAIPRALADRTKMEMIQRIYYYGPESVGYVRIKDSLVPAHLGPGDRMSLAESSVNAEIIMPLSV